DDEAEPRQYLGAEKFESRERCRVQALEKAALAVSQHDVAHPEEAAEHHVHGEDAGEEPIDIRDGLTGHRLAPGIAVLRDEKLLHDVALGRVGVDPVAHAAIEIEEQI